MFVLSNEYVVQFLDLIADREIVITGKELSDELDKINKPTKLRVITEKKIERKFEIDHRAKKIYLNSEIYHENYI